MKIKRNISKKKNLSADHMKVKELCFIAVIAAIEFIVFTSFSFVLYLECITITIILFATIFSTKQAVLGSLIFSLVNLVMQGVTPWSIMYVLIYPTYSLFIGIFKNYLNKHFIILCILCGILSFLTGQLVQIPFILISKHITIYYILAGLKVSIPQGIITGSFCFLCYKPLYAVLQPIIRRLNNEKTM